MSMLDFDVPGLAAMLVLLPGCYVLWACISRLDLMTPANSSPLWRWLYVAAGTWVGWVMADALASWALDVRDAAGVVWLALYLWATRSVWQVRVPPVAASQGD